MTDVGPFQCDVNVGLSDRELLGDRRAAYDNGRRHPFGVTRRRSQHAGRPYVRGGGPAASWVDDVVATRAPDAPTDTARRDTGVADQETVLAGDDDRPPLTVRVR